MEAATLATAAAAIEQRRRLARFAALLCQISRGIEAKALLSSATSKIAIAAALPAFPFEEPAHG